MYDNELAIFLNQHYIISASIAFYMRESDCRNFSNNRPNFNLRCYVDKEDQSKNDNRLYEWKKKYTEVLIEALKPVGDILEIGFDLGFGAEAIQKHHPKTHTIIEEDHQRFLNAKVWAGRKENVTVIKGKWKEELKNLKKFDAIFFNEYPFPERDMPVLNYLFSEDTKKTSVEAKKLINDIQEQMSHLKMKFSDSDIESFYQHIGRINLNDLPMFFKKLKDNGNISSDQYEECLKKYHLQNPLSQKSDNSIDQNEKSQMTSCLETCLKGHMNIGSRFSSFLIKQTSNYEDQNFYDKIITNSMIDYREDSVAIELSDKTFDALIMLVKKNG